MSSPILAARDLRVVRGGRVLLDGVSVDAHAGEVLCVIGPNGAGKSTLLTILSGMAAPASGAIALDGRPLGLWEPLARARAISYLPQSFAPHWDLSVADLMGLGRRRGQPWFELWPTRAEPPASNDDHFEIGSLTNRHFRTLSGGEQARVRCAAALAGPPPLALIADEPMAHLDIGHQVALVGRLRALAARMAVIVVVHDLNLAARLADRLLLLDRGRCAALGAAAEVLRGAALDQAFGVAFRRIELDGRLALLPATDGDALAGAGPGA
jgi:iron complex transport system ATP-binding protein